MQVWYNNKADNIKRGKQKLKITVYKVHKNNVIQIANRDNL